MDMMNEKTKKMLKVVVPIVIALLSMFVVARFAASAEFHAKTIESLDEKKATVMELTAASTAASAAITLIPGDVGNPIAEKLADLSSYFLLVLCALYLEKYLLTITGYAAFVILIPMACVLYSINVYRKSELLKRIMKKMVFFSLAIVLVIPVSIKVSDMIEDTYQISVENTLESAKEATEEIEKKAEKDGEEGVISGIISTVREGVSGITTKIQTVLNNFIEALAVMLVTSCVIPVVVLLLFGWLIKTVLGVDVNKNTRKRING